MNFLRKNWLILLILSLVVVAAIVIYKKWPRTKRSITFTDLPVIVSSAAGAFGKIRDAITDDDEDDTTHAHDSPSDLDDLISSALSSYDDA